MLVANENIWGADLRSEYSWVPFLQSPIEQKNSSTLFFKFHFWQLPLIFMTSCQVNHCALGQNAPSHCWVKSFWGAKVQSVFSSLPPLVYSPFHRRGLYQGLALSDKTEFSTLHFQSLSIQSRDLGYCWKHAFLWGSILTNPSCFQYKNEDVSDKAWNTRFNSFHHHSLCLPSFIMAKYEIGSKSFPHRKLLKLQFIEFWPNSYTES